MARTIQQIFDSIQAARAADPGLVQLTSPSAVALHRLFATVVAAALWAHETIFDRFRAEVDQIIARAPIGTAAWFVARVKEWQPNTQLVLVDGRPGYATPDPAARLITQASAREDDTARLVVKVAKGDAAAGELEPLTSEEQREAFAYLDRIRPAGIRLSLASREADRLRLAGQVVFDPLLDPVALAPKVRTALTTALRSLPFDGELLISSLVDAVQAVPGVVDVTLAAAVRLGADAPIAVVRSWNSPAGYLVEEDEADFDWLTTLEFVPDASY